MYGRDKKDSQGEQETWLEVWEGWGYLLSFLLFARLIERPPPPPGGVSH